MELIVVLIGLAVQRLLNFNSAPYHHNWVSAYHGWLGARFSFLVTLQGYAKLLIVVLPFILVASIFLLLCINYLEAGSIGFYLLFGFGIV